MMRAGIDIGGTKLRVGLTDADGVLLADRKLKTAEIGDFPAAVTETLSALCAEQGTDISALISVGIGVPGTVSADGKQIVKVPNIANLPENLGEELEKALGVPVFLMQDSRAAAWGEYLRGGGAGAKCLVCLTLGTGIGTGIVWNGSVWHGALGCAGELGHLPAVKGGRPCGCGKSGCLEKYAAGRGLDITASGLLGADKTAEDLFRAAENGNADAERAITDAVRMLGDAVCAVVNLLSPDRILFSGGLAEQEKRYLLPLIDYVKEHCYSAGTYPVLAKASLGADAPLIGAALIPSAYVCLV